MPRPSKRRRICGMPPCRRFDPQGNHKESLPVILTLDEYETIRLIDFMGLTQEQCAAQMNVARATVQAIYGGARGKIARSLVMGQPLEIGGGDVVLCEQQNHPCAACPGRGRAKNGRNTIMKIAVTYDNGQIYQHFGHCAQFKLYEIEDGKVVSSKIIDATGSGHSLLAGFLMMNGVDDVICGGIGGGAQMALRGFGIKIHGGVQGDADAAVAALLGGTLEASDAPNCSHHDAHHGAEHVCGEHGCGDDHECHCHD
ncbi:MAG: DUF134 domain-containing protein [Clostridiales bacterium]|nr:DUF134 domain-containing protein [Clostridiales bacterium]